VYSELVESLRCVRAHAPTGLVAVAYETSDRDIVRGALGCPECKAEYAIADATADFRDGAEGPALPPAKSRPEDVLAMRAGALLGLEEPGGVVVLAGAWTAAAPELAALTQAVKILALDAAPGVASGDGISLARTAGVIPLRAATARGIALDAAHASASDVSSAVEALAPRGRLIAPVTCTVPDGVRELARDARDWVGERLAAPAVVPLARAPKGAPAQPPSPES
jgi:hypothetical protein